MITIWVAASNRQGFYLSATKLRLRLSPLTASDWNSLQYQGLQPRFKTLAVWIRQHHTYYHVTARDRTFTTDFLLMDLKPITFLDLPLPLTIVLFSIWSTPPINFHHTCSNSKPPKTRIFHVLYNDMYHNFLSYDCILYTMMSCATTYPLQHSHFHDSLVYCLWRKSEIDIKLHIRRFIFISSHIRKYYTLRVCSKSLINFSGSDIPANATGVWRSSDIEVRKTS